jgi:hypothetical protein
LATHRSTAAASATNADLTRHRFPIDSGSAARVLVGLAMSLAMAELPTDPDALRALSDVRNGMNAVAGTSRSCANAPRKRKRS